MTQDQEFEVWWETEGQYLRSGGGAYEKTFAYHAWKKSQAPKEMQWPQGRDVGRIGDMSPSDSLRVGLDSDNDVYLSVYSEDGSGSVEFCAIGPGGGKSSRTRTALIALMVAIEADNTEDPDRDWWKQRAVAKSSPA